MERLNFSNYAELGNYIYELVCTEEKTVSVVLFYKEALELLKWFLAYDDIETKCIDIQNKGYDKEYFLTLDSNLTFSVHSTCDSVEAEQHSIDIFLFNEDASIKTFLNGEENYEVVIEEENNICKNCLMDCTECAYREETETLTEAFGIVEYIINHLGD